MLMLAFGSRPETALIFAVCAVTFSLIIAWKKKNYLVLFVICAGFFLGQAFTTTPTVNANERLVAVVITGTETKSPQPAQSVETKSPQPAQSVETKSPQPAQSVETKYSKKCKFENQVLVDKSGEFVCVKMKTYAVVERDPIAEAKSQILRTQILEYKRNVNRLDARSALPESICKFNFNGILQTIFCNVSELPFRLPTFLFRPLPLIDSGTGFLFLASFENVIWIFLILSTVLRVSQRKRTQKNRMVTSFLLFFLISFSIAAALYEGNLGTAFRHKSTILWPSILILILTSALNEREKRI
jgi:hypothetical protein